VADVSVLSGYAAQYAQAVNAGANDSQAHAAATAATGGSGFTVQQLAHTVTGNTVNAGNFSVDANGYVVNGYGPSYPGQGAPPPSSTVLKARGPEDLPALLTGLKPSGDTLAYVFLGALGIFTLRMFGK